MRFNEKTVFSGRAPKIKFVMSVTVINVITVRFCLRRSKMQFYGDKINNVYIVMTDFCIHYFLMASVI